MSRPFEELFGKCLIVSVFVWFSVEQSASILAIVRFHGHVELWGLALTSRVFSLIFLLMVVFLTVTRLPPRETATGIEPRLTAIAGTFALMALVVLPTGSVGKEMMAVAATLIVIGTMMSIYCLYWLGRSFSIMATARRLVTSGPYAVIRHPLYVAEAVTVIGIVLSNWSVAAILVGTIQFALQIRRMHNEERVLRKTFPEYEEYARVVPMFIPFHRPRGADGPS